MATESTTNAPITVRVRVGSRSAFLVYAALLSTIGLLASDMYLPSLEVIRSHFRSDAGDLGLSLSLYMAGFAAAQSVYGALSDQVGRKPPLLFGLCVFVAGTIGCVTASGIEQFLAFRLVQSIGVGAAYVLWQPMMFDFFEGDALQRMFARLMAVGSLSPALAPVVGGYLTNAFGWQSVFWVLGAIGSLLVVITWLACPESLPVAARRAFSMQKLLAEYGSLFADRFFMGNAGALGCGIGTYFVYVAMLPLVLARLGYMPKVIGLMSLPIVATFIVGTEVSRVQKRRLGDRGSCRLGAALGLFGSCSLLVATVRNASSPWALISPAAIVTFGNGFLLPTGTAHLIKSYGASAGACASALGFLTALSAATATLLASRLVDHLGANAMSGTALLFACLMNASLYLAGRAGPRGGNPVRGDLGAQPLEDGWSGSS